MVTMTFQVILLLITVTAVTEGSDCTVRPLGLQNGGVSGSSVSYSSVDTFYYKEGDIANRGCSETPVRPTERRVGWCPDYTDVSPYVQLNLGATYAVQGFIFQNISTECNPIDSSLPTYMASYSLLYTNPGDPERSLTLYDENLPALAMTHRERTQHLSSPVVTDTVRIVPDMTTASTFPCFRLDVLVCDTANMCETGWCNNVGSCAGKNICACPTGFFGSRCEDTAADVETQDYAFNEIKDNQLLTPEAVFDVHGDVTLVTPSSRRRRHGPHGPDPHGPHGPHGPDPHGPHGPDPHGPHGHEHHGPHIHLSGHHSYCEHNHQNHHSHDHHDHHSSSHCMSNLNSHHSGFTTSIHYQPSAHSHQSHSCLFSNGGNLAGHVGASLHHSHGSLNFHVNSNTHHYHIQQVVHLIANTWSQITVSWHPQTGVSIKVNGTNICSSSHATPQTATQTVPLRLGNGHNQQTSTTVTVNATMNLANLVMFNTSVSNLANVNIQATAPPPTTTTVTTPSTTPAPTTTTVKKTATSAHTTTTQAFLTHPMCYSCQSESKPDSCTKTTLCEAGEVCTVFHDRTGYTSKCLLRQDCEGAKKVASGYECYECCDSYLCNNNCTTSSGKMACADKPTCAVLMSTGFNVCKDSSLAIDICKKSCNLC